MTQQELVEQKPPTQKERTLSMLRTLHQGVCGTMFLEARMPRYAARILDLKHDGHRIEKISCPYSYHGHAKAIATYRLNPLYEVVDDGGEAS